MAIQSVPEPTADHYRAMQRLQRTAVVRARRGWSQVSPGAISASWREILPLVELGVADVQLDAATAGTSYAAETLADREEYVAPAAFTDPTSLVGVATDGRALALPLYAPAITAKQAIRHGASPREALAIGGRTLDRLVATTVTDTARTAAMIDIGTRTGVGYTRMLNPPSCSRCAILAGRFYRWNAGFLRHPHCFPAGVAISGPASEAATRRWYEGELVVLTTASGKKLPLTGNHPVLTRRGWVPAHLIEEGDEVVRSTRPEGAAPLNIPDHHQVPALIEDVWRSLGMFSGSVRMPMRTEHFHGDGQDGEVDVVHADGALRDRLQTAVTEHLSEKPLTARIVGTLGLLPEGRAALLGLAGLAGPSGTVGCECLMLPLSSGHLLGADLPGFTHAASLDTGVRQDTSDRAAGDAVLLSESVLAGTGEILADDLIARKVENLPRWDAPAGPLTVESRDGYASRGLDLLKRLSGQVELDRVVQASRVEWRGHVYSLTSSEGWHNANSLIVSNCDCVHVPAKATEHLRDEGLIADPYEYFQSLSPEDQRRIFGRSEARAITDGADIFQVVNARRGMTRVGQIPATRARTTTEGTTRRGHFGGTTGRGVRRTVDEIYRTAGTRTRALRMLEEDGYILPGGQNPTGSLRGQREGFGALGRGGTRRAASDAVLEARRTGRRDPKSRYTMTEAERRRHDADRNWQMIQAGINPYQAGAAARWDALTTGKPIPRGGSLPRPLTDADRARAETAYRKYALGLDGGDPALPH